jgi:hypothetical protein
MHRMVGSPVARPESLSSALGAWGNFALLEHTDVGSDVHLLLLGQPRGHKR